MSVTTNFVFAETVTLIQYRLSHAAAVTFRAMLTGLTDGGLLQYVRATPEHEAAAWAVFEQYDDQKLSYTDCISCAVMRDLKIERAFTADRHFATFGFTLIP